MGISPDSLVLIQDNLNHDTLFLTSTKSVIGWTALPNSIRIYFHQVKSYFHFHIVLTIVYQLSKLLMKKTLKLLIDVMLGIFVSKLFLLSTYLRKVTINAKMFT